MIGFELELVRDSETADSFFNTVTNLGRVMELYNHEAIARNALQTVFDLLQQYDRGMVYRFNDDLSGEVIYEIKRDWVKTSYEGLRFPASDIPLTSRLLYIQNGLRYIHDVNRESVPLVTPPGQQIDLSQCRMRAGMYVVWLWR